MTATIGEMTAALRANNIAHGFRCPEGGPGDNTLGDYIALLGEEIGEATSAYRSWKLEDRTERVVTAHREVGLEDQPVKPLGVGSELADVLIRLLDTGDVFGFAVFDRDMQLGDVAELYPERSDPQLPKLVSFGDHMAWLARRVDKIWTDTSEAPLALRALVTIARKYGIDLDFEYERKHAYNLTRPYQHGGRVLTATGA
jgi:NTP pyrophosphatase (non-canonical NTP hydrolase)